MIKGKKYVLTPLTSYQVSEDYRAMKKLRERIKVDEKKSEGESYTIVPKKRSDLANNKKNMCIIAKPDNCLKGMDEERFLVCLVNTNLLLNSNHDTSTLPSIVSSLLQDYDDLFLKDMPKGLTPLRGLEHQIDFVLDSQISNIMAYMSNSKENRDLQMQVEELFESGLIK